MRTSGGGLKKRNEKRPGLGRFLRLFREGEFLAPKGEGLKFECACGRRFNKFRVRGTRLTLPLAGKVSKGAVKGKPFRMGFPLTIPFLNDQEGLTTPLDSP